MRGSVVGAALVSCAFCVVAVACSSFSADGDLADAATDAPTTSDAATSDATTPDAATDLDATVPDADADPPHVDLHTPGAPYDCGNSTVCEEQPCCVISDESVICEPTSMCTNGFVRECSKPSDCISGACQVSASGFRCVASQAGNGILCAQGVACFGNQSCTIHDCGAAKSVATCSGTCGP